MGDGFLGNLGFLIGALGGIAGFDDDEVRFFLVLFGRGDALGGRLDLGLDWADDLGSDWGDDLGGAPLSFFFPSNFDLIFLEATFRVGPADDAGDVFFLVFGELGRRVALVGAFFLLCLLAGIGGIAGSAAGSAAGC